MRPPLLPLTKHNHVFLIFYFTAAGYGVSRPADKQVSYSIVDAVKCRLTELTTWSKSLTFAVGSVWLHVCAFPRISCVLGPKGVAHVAVCISVQVVSISLSLSFFVSSVTLLRVCIPFIRFSHVCVRGSLLSSQVLPAIGWELSLSKSWLPMVEAPGCQRHPTSTRLAISITCSYRSPFLISGMTTYERHVPC